MQKCKNVKIDANELDEVDERKLELDKLTAEFGHVNDGTSKHYNLSYFNVYKYSTSLDKLLIFFGIIASIGVGAALPINFIIFSDVIDSFLGSNKKGSTTTSSSATTATTIAAPVLPMILEKAQYFSILGACVFVLGMIQGACWFITSENQARRIRSKLFHSMLYQNMAWFDANTSGSLVLSLTEQVSTIENGIGDKASIFIQYFSGFLGGFIVSFIYGWLLTLVALSLTPLLVLNIVAFNLFMKFLSKKEIIAYGKAGTIAEEVLSSIRTVYAFSGENKEVDRYSENLDAASKAGIKKSIVIGICMGGIPMCVFSASALVFWYGTKLILDEGLTPGVVIQVFFCVIIGSISLGNALPSLEYFSNATAAANVVFSIIERKPTIDARIIQKKPNKMIGKIDFKNIEFRYPGRLDALILKDYNLSIRAGETIALVGGSGSGKSTIMQMLQRFYDPIDGKVMIDDEDLTQLDISWYRSNVGVVQQEPHLFSGTVIENIILGRPDASRDEVEKAAKDANAHDFIMKLPQDYDTFIGENGGLLSGGQKQRIAIARALLRNPTILLLDEATSALDNRSEKVVQDALDRAASVRGRTVVMIAHRLSTVRNVDRIIVMDKGIITEMGNHDELITLGGWYAQAIKNQSMKGDNNNENENQNLTNEKVENNDEKIENEDEDVGTSYMRRLSSIKSETKEVIKKESHGGIMRVMKMNSPECALMIFGCICAAVAGASQPAFAVIMSEFISVFTLIGNPPEMMRKSSMYAGIMVGIAVAGFLAGIGKNVFFGIAGERLTARLRVLLFKSIMKQEIGWFDEETNQPGILTTRLANDASKVQGISGPRLGVFCETMVIFLAAFTIGFVYSWQLTLTIVAFIPLIIMAGIIQGRLVSGQTGRGGTMDIAGRTALEILAGIRTIVSLGREENMFERFHAFLVKDAKFIRQAVLLPFFNGLAQSVFFFIYAAVFTLGGRLVDDKLMDFVAVFRVFSVITFGSAAVGRAMSFAPDAGKAAEAAENTFSIIDRQPKSVNVHGVGNKPSNTLGVINFDNVFFRYPTRTEVKVLQGLTFSVQPGTTVALVGGSGCGKSTVMTFPTRFYEAEAGSIQLDGNNIKDLDVDWLRKQCGLVSQEPSLFNRSILENISYGDNSRDEIPLEEVIEAAKQANAHSFISSLPKGYDTMVGARGSQLSGGQKQRIAIARALLRKPKILLLDEATSALDSESEVIVQEALDAARVGRTCLVIAHRLSTIRNADNIVVVQDGRVVEEGTHDKLLSLRGVYYKFLNLDAS